MCQLNNSNNKRCTSAWKYLYLVESTYGSFVKHGFEENRSIKLPILLTPKEPPKSKITYYGISQLFPYDEAFYYFFSEGVIPFIVNSFFSVPDAVQQTLFPFRSINPSP